MKAKPTALIEAIDRAVVALLERAGLGDTSSDAAGTETQDKPSIDEMTSVITVAAKWAEQRSKLVPKEEAPKVEPRINDVRRRFHGEPASRRGSTADDDTEAGA